MAVQETRVLPPKFIEDLATDYGTQLTALTSQARDTAKFAPTVAAQDPLQQQAATLASSGIGSFQPFVTAAQQQATAAGTQLGTAATGIAGAEALLGTGAGTGAGASLGATLGVLGVRVSFSRETDIDLLISRFLYTEHKAATCFLFIFEVWLGEAVILSLSSPLGTVG